MKNQIRITKSKDFIVVEKARFNKDALSNAVIVTSKSTIYIPINTIIQVSLNLDSHGRDTIHMKAAGNTVFCLTLEQIHYINSANTMDEIFERINKAIY